ncbi:clr5 domain-containing protein [Hirsutella rhossiliensis]|uniref:Clr5 domain-containing protein n=1 Tax=Hirsutella rhossiliensis TaxID=111463 RepID=A0A9P8MT22_9HYPO|nr:clr5 domain-containing protein [Hirsutella rhossiliensis]KAH0961633.1 clr5 domain-containing protein [Hirsutella rhossiliensis]
MTKPFDSYRGEIVRLYIDENKTLEVVMDLMRARHCFTASRRSYMDNLKKWGVRKYKRKVVVHNQNGSGDQDPDDDRQGSAVDEYGVAPLSPSAPEDAVPRQSGAQSLVLPYHRDHAPSAAVPPTASSAAAHGFPPGHDAVQLQHEPAGGSHDYGWGYFAHSHWPVDEAASLSSYASQYVADNTPQAGLAARYFNTHASALDESADQPNLASSHGGTSQESQHRWHRYAGR